jgi:hypothetical protein
MILPDKNIKTINFGWKSWSERDLADARAWLLDVLSYDDDGEEIENAPAVLIVYNIEKNYEGGGESFKLDFAG